ncbi:pentapeptide repeat-containing protein [Anabaena sp. FACHB-1237]|uniref:serine/threonine-protein kinase n=1 Tax=Anabaena sp. FACHB-1237 TaxID=2692769 RepID=UPI001680AC62|nr:serine/threonine-protein kinase [Anabaena sp. FACHB-1237]MBD2139687.1 pentapeptide repeat-containing protein [Anabaena sp. FACHB-1237]
MSYCVNPNCSSPKNASSSLLCQSCGTKLVLRDRFRIIKQIGQGGFGATFLAVEENLPGKPPCVVKQLRPSGTTPYLLNMARELFSREAETLGKIGNHPQIPRILDYFEDNERFYLVQEYVSGDTLLQEVKKNGTYSEVGVRQFLSEVMPLVQYIHDNQVIHRDIKPANLIRRSQDARLVLIDFGAVKNKVNQVPTNQVEHIVLTAYAVGTPGFAPPEQIAMRPVYASDIYAVGITCIFLLTGKNPKNLEYNPTTGEIMWEHLVNISDHLIKVLKKMLDVSIKNRYKTAKEVLRDLDIEPYLESLEGGMISQPFTDGLESTSSGSSNERSSNENISKIAAAIRAKKARNSGGISATTNDPARRYSHFNNKNSNINQGTSLERKLDSQSFMSAYSKGRRDFANYTLQFLRLPGINLSESNFHGTQFIKANLQGADLHNSDFGSSSLIKANLKDTDLTKAYLSNANLQDADLRGADLRYAYMSKANLRNANLCGANLTGAKITDEQLELAKTNWLTVRPNGKRSFFWNLRIDRINK